MYNSCGIEFHQNTLEQKNFCEKILYNGRVAAGYVCRILC